MKNDNEHVMILRKKKINVTMKILIVILCNDTVVALRPPDEHKAVCSNTHTHTKQALLLSFSVLAPNFCFCFSPFL